MADGETGILRVVSFNIRYGTARDGLHSWPLRRRGVRELMRTLGYDACGLQEVMNQQREYLAAGLHDDDWYGVGRTDGFHEGEQAPLVVRRAAIDVDDWSTKWLAEDPDSVGSRGWDAKIPRVATVVRGRHLASGGDVGIINTHFDHRGARAQHESARLIADIVRLDASRRWLVMGDFNVGIGAPALTALREAGLRSALPSSAGGTFHGWSGATDRQRIDHIFIGPGWTVVRSGIRLDRPWGILPSDHWPVFADLRPS
ncbi:endonuclease/exonuclease/phosphatase family metal-dependent hydrolase [Antricoccus suffuscus]|uniref:Endonuclease/exonuclease/phosphatase family metal-dependent hydrolase n=1 Tax=Antricoccus suffuscus TaxID=1629062 RepID=A0A2T1A501_9ACTN|nr:endonuclease/exonuclease/phosphatase family protein [Antricoccus suffuscus]PRZ43418.1 endonuclease/exonuclease/phosphatase family metal-dependent hydrolase [Antricoccus suffuscus]